jgi:C-terminal processing protease CtpA/Prc
VFGIEVKAWPNGVSVARVVKGSHAAKARLRAGDYIAEVAGIEVDSVETYSKVMEESIGDLPLTFLVVRDNRGYYINLP